MKLGRALVAGVLGLVALGLVLALTLPAGESPATATAGTAGEGAAYAELERQVRKYPADERAWVLKARLDVQAGRHELAAAGYAKAIAIGRKVARDPGVWVEYAEARGLAQGGSLLGEPQVSIDRALALDGRHPQALDLAGSAGWEAGDFALAAQHWRRLLALMPERAADSTRRDALERAVQRAEMRARLSLPREG
jgi:cytochrome c-type biogenesis protein CcmH